MLIHFGLYLDGLNPNPPVTAVGEISVGPQGLLGILETDLGLPPVLDHPAEQLMAYRGCLAQADHPGRFYHRSFAVDPINVARTLMDWRAEWFDAGWTGRFPEEVSGRLADMADVERLAEGRVPLCHGQRVQRVLGALTGRRTQIQRIVLCDDPLGLSASWRNLLERLGYEIAPGVQPVPRASRGTDLHALQSELIHISTRAESGAAPAIRLAGDDSFVVVQADSRDVSARAIAELLREADGSSETVVIAERDGIIVDNALERTGLPRCGFQHYSRFRAVSQVLKLCLALLWEPINPHLLLQFLIHPLGPVPSRVRARLAEAVASQPGIGGKAWNEAVERIEAREREGGATDLQIRRLHGDIDYWFRSGRFAPSEGAPVTVLMERAQRCSNWLNARLAGYADGGERAMFGAAVGQSEALMAALARLHEQGHATLRKIEVDRLIDEAARQQPDPNVFAQAHHVRAATHPGAITGPWPRVVWWDLGPQNADLSYPWSAAELTRLRDAGVALPSVDDRLGQRSSQWLRPICNASEQLIVVMHAGDEGRHPLWSQIASRFSGWAEVRIDACLLRGEAVTVPHLQVATEAIAVQPLPGPRRWWELPAGVAIPARPVESFSSLSRLFYYPHEWVLQYPAAIRNGRAADLADGGLLYGSLAHRLFEKFFTEIEDWQGMDPARLLAWLDHALPALIAEEGAVLLEPGRGVDRQYVTATLERALARLITHLRSANAVAVVPEHHEQQPYLDVALRGDLDLLVIDDQGREIVIDAKWGGQKFRAEQLEHNQHLQLAAYAYLRKTAAGGNRWPYPAYFIVTTGNMLTPDDRVFPLAFVHEPVHEPDADAEGIEELWTRGEATYRWRREQLGARHIEVNVEGTEPTRRSEPPDSALDTDVWPDAFDDFAGLTGWGEFS